MPNSQNRFPARVWGTLTPPRRVTAVMVSIYVLIIALGFQVVANAFPPESFWGFIAAILTSTGGLAGIISAWRGDKRMEVPAIGLIIGGMILILISRIPVIFQLERWPLTITMTLIIALFSAQRLIRIWDVDQEKQDATERANEARERYHELSE